MKGAYTIIDNLLHRSKAAYNIVSMDNGAI